jgi:hypothetical protein
MWIFALLYMVIEVHMHLIKVVYQMYLVVFNILKH